MRSDEDLLTYCSLRQDGTCRAQPGACTYKHEYLKAAEKVRLKHLIAEKKRSASATPAPVKGGCKGGKKGGKSRTPSRSQSESSSYRAQVPMLYCKQYCDTGDCKKEGCQAPHLNQDAVHALRAIYGEEMEKFRQFILGPKGKGKGGGKDGKGKKGKGKGKGKKQGSS